MNEWCKPGDKIRILSSVNSLRHGESIGYVATVHKYGGQPSLRSGSSGCGHGPEYYCNVHTEEGNCILEYERIDDEYHQENNLYDHINIELINRASKYL